MRNLLLALVIGLSVPGPVIPLPEAELHPANDKVGTWDFYFTHDELEQIRAIGGLNKEFQDLLVQRQTAPPRPVVISTGGTRRSTYSGGVEQWRSAVESYFRAGDVAWAMRVMNCESGGDPNAYNPSTATGLFQIKAFWLNEFPGNLWDPYDNIRIASQIYYKYGASQWVCR